MKQVFLDTNVIIDYLGNRTGFYDDAAIIMSLAINQKIELYAAAISFATASYILSKNNDNNRIKTLIADFCNICKVVATDEECVSYAIRVHTSASTSTICRWATRPLRS